MTAAGSTDRAEALRAAVNVLTDVALAHIVDLVAFPDGAGIVVANAEGASRIDRDFPDLPAVLLRGRDPIGCQDPLAFASADLETADPSPPNSRQSYPFAGRRLVSAFADPRAPDLVVVHSAGHHWPERGGHLGEHGSLNVVQSRAPLLVSGAGVKGRGVLPRAARVVDVAPTLAWLAGVPLAGLAGLDGQPLIELVGPGATRVVGLLWDGANCSDLLSLAATGRLPAVARLMERGCALAGGAVAEFPSVTLVNHTSALTGVGPGRHGIVGNAFYDRATGQQGVPNDAANWHRAMDWLRPGVSTVFEWVSAGRPGARTACVNDPVDRGATYSTFALVRAAGAQGSAPQGASSLRAALPDAALDPHASQAFVAASDDYRWGTQVDGMGLAQVLELWSDPPAAPALLWWNTTLTDTGHHGGGPRSPMARASLSDADRRLGVFLDKLDASGQGEDTVVLLTGDHGSEAADPGCRGDWDEALRAAGIPFRDEGYGAIYLGVEE
ncbi:MAG: alkaline phosphatase family protein [Actinomycetota bacterium]|nr:alkaline phosphatase family protein [Actinomycetota bacterium]